MGTLPFYLVSRQSAAKQMRDTIGEFEPTRSTPLRCEVDLHTQWDPIQLELESARAVHTLIRQIRRGDFVGVRFQDPKNPDLLHRLGIHLGQR